MSSNAYAVQAGESTAAYIDELRGIPPVRAVFEDNSDGLTLLTVYDGTRERVEIDLYEAQARVLRRFPCVPIDFHIMSVAQAERHAPEQSMRKIFGR